MSTDQRVGLVIMLWVLLCVIFASSRETFEFMDPVAVLTFGIGTLLFLRKEGVK